MSTLKQANSDSPKSALLEDQLDINLRHSCVDCPFVISCPVTQDKGAPDVDVLIGSYRPAALATRCLL
ncbi:MAG TPA: hypothetical protein VJN71_01135 [Nitrososphaerales archaeon]|nr:hypothetical protein [Nitrososphaerales archaeon]